MLSQIQNTTLVDTPIELNVKYIKDEGDTLSDPTLSLILPHSVSSVVFLTVTWLDISHVVMSVSS